MIETDDKPDRALDVTMASIVLIIVLVMVLLLSAAFMS